MDATTYPYQISVGRRWPVRHHSGPGVENTHPPKWWRPHHPKRRRYFHSRLSANAWDGLTGWTSTAAHRGVVRKANRRWRYQGKAALRRGDYDARPYVGVAWVW